MAVEIFDGVRYLHVSATEMSVKGLANKQLKKVQILGHVCGKTVTSIEPQAFEDTFVQEVILPHTVNLIGFRAFYNCKQLQKVEIQAQDVRIGSYAFGFCSNLKSFTGCNLHIEQFAFSNCVNLVEVSGQILSLQSFAFRNAMSLKELHFLDAKDCINEDCFLDCSALNTFIFYGIWDGMKDFKFFQNKNIFCKKNSNIFELAYYGINVQDISILNI